MSSILGISLQGRGAICRLRADGRLLDVRDTLRRSRGEIDAVRLADLLARWRPSHAFLAAQDSARDLGAVEAVLSLCGVPVTRLEPAQVRTAGSLPRVPAEHARAEAIARAGLGLLELICAAE